MEVDVLIVGAGPAGSTTARFCAGNGLDVLMIDRRSEIGHPVQCGEFLPAAKEMYDIFPESMDLEELFTVEPELVAGTSNAIDLVSPRGKAYRCAFEGSTLDRRSFDKWLVKLAIERGARLETSASLLSIVDGVAKTTIGDIRPKVIVGADGPNSRTADQVGLKGPSLNYPAVTCQAEGSFEPVVKMQFGRVAPAGYAWIIPKRSGANVGVGFRPRSRGTPPSVVFQRLASRLGIKYSGVTMGFVPVSGPVGKTVSGNALLVGDSAGFTMATNGGGIPTAMIGGRIAGQVIRKHLKGGAPLEEYESRWKGVMRKPLQCAVRTRRMGDVVFPFDAGLGLAMALLGRRGLDRAIRCKPVFYAF